MDYNNKILFTSSRSGKEQLYTMNPDGTNIKQITSGQYWHNNGR
ncbi:MAG: TolB family protein [Ignavibacteria bacterium]